jgi:hypothetical protein
LIPTRNDLPIRHGTTIRIPIDVMRRYIPPCPPPYMLLFCFVFAAVDDGREGLAVVVRHGVGGGGGDAAVAGRGRRKKRKKEIEWSDII